MNRALNLVRIICALALALAVAGCSTVKIGYDNLPTLAHWWLDSYFDFTSAQAPRAREELARVHQWHRTTELPRWVEWLRQAEHLVHGDLTAAQACTLLEGGRQRLQALADHVEPALADFALALTPEQLSHLARRFEKNNEEFRQDWIQASPAQVQERRLKQAAERLERLYGRLEEAQRTVLRQQLDASPYEARRALAERRRRQADTLQVLRELQVPDTPAAQARQQVRGLLQRTLHSPDPSYRELQAAMLQHQCGVWAAVHQAASPQQRQIALRRLQAWQRDLGELARAAK